MARNRVLIDLQRRRHEGQTGYLSLLDKEVAPRWRLKTCTRFGMIQVSCRCLSFYIVIGEATQLITVSYSSRDLASVSTQYELQAATESQVTPSAEVKHRIMIMEVTLTWALCLGAR
jgi:hypothetical protein